MWKHRPLLPLSGQFHTRHGNSERAFIYIIHALPSFQFDPSVSHGDETGVVLKAVYSFMNSTFFLYCISNTDIASGILADRNL